MTELNEIISKVLLLEEKDPREQWDYLMSLDKSVFEEFKESITELKTRLSKIDSIFSDVQYRKRLNEQPQRFHVYKNDVLLFKEVNYAAAWCRIFWNYFDVCKSGRGSHSGMGMGGTVTLDDEDYIFECCNDELEKELLDLTSLNLEEIDKKLGSGKFEDMEHRDLYELRCKLGLAPVKYDIRDMKESTSDKEV